MEIRVLRYFLTVVREESITKASEVLHITQPTLSRQLSQMEEEVGVKLFNRGTRKITLTNEGILLRRRAEEIHSPRTITGSLSAQKIRLSPATYPTGFRWLLLQSMQLLSRCFSRKKPSSKIWYAQVR